MLVIIHFMALASDERRERNEENGSVKINPNNTNGVVITLYKEALRRRVSEDPTNNTKPRGIGHDRRALLLAYSGELRNEACHKLEANNSNFDLSTSESKDNIEVLSFFAPSRRQVKGWTMVEAARKSSNAKKEVACKMTALLWGITRSLGNMLGLSIHLHDPDK
ncbi:hypothetical protein ACSQ67_019016 [Phaseolus vulgaris]